MALYIASDTDLTSVADAIRSKTHESAALEFPNGFTDAIYSISGGSGTDVSTTTATAGDVMVGKYFFNAAGQRTAGTFDMFALTVNELNAL